MTWSCFAVALLALAGSSLGELQPIEAKGSKFFYKNGTQFFMKGVAYQQNSAAAGGTVTDVKYVDPLSDEKLCKRDVPFLQDLGTNTIRTYAIDPAADHSGCMRILQEAGIYVISDLGEPGLSINREDPQWNTDLFGRYQRVVDELSRYPNVIGFFAGNEVTNERSNTAASAYVKAAVRDTKRYIKNSENITRWLGVGYAANDDADIREHSAHYFNCDAVDDSIDFWGYNIYSWCGDSNIQKAQYDLQVDFFRNYSVPVFFAEYGCNKGGGAANRLFTETRALYSDVMTPVFSGGIVYMYFQEENDFGLVEVSDGQVTKMKDFDALKKHVTQANPKGVEMSDYTPANTMEECPVLADTWQAHKALPPTPDKGLCDCMSRSRSCAPRPGLSAKKIGDIFSYICGTDSALCVGISGNATTGVYGAYSMCDDGAKLAYVLDVYHRKVKQGAASCDFDGAATLRQSPPDEASCAAALASASDVNRQAATATAPVRGKPTATEDDSSASHGPLLHRVWQAGDFSVHLYLAAAFGAGVAMIAL